MNKGLVIGITAVAIAGFTGSALAGLPCAAYSGCGVGVTVVVGCPNASADAVWALDGSRDLITVSVTVHDCLDDPIDTCTVRLDYSNSGFDAQSGGEAVNAIICGLASGVKWGQTDANGIVTFDLTGGGCGALVLNYTVTAECASPEVELCAASDTLCVKGTDINGDGIVDFNDAIPLVTHMINATTSHCTDVNCDGIVDFNDAIPLVTDLINAASCSGLSISDGTATTGDCPLP